MPYEMNDYNFALQALESDTGSLSVAAQLLRTYTSALLNLLLAKKSPVTEQLPELTAVLSLQDLQAVTSVTLWKTKNFRPLSATNDKKNKDKKTPAQLLAHMTHTCRTEKTDPRLWQETTHHYLTEALDYGSQTNDIPPLWRTILESIAWTDLTFRCSLLTNLHGYLEERMLLIPGEPCIPQIAPGTFWALIGLSETGDCRRQKMLKSLVTRFRNQARKYAMKEHWAGFWDQWLISIALLKWPSLFVETRDPFIHSLLNLPLLSTLPQTARPPDPIRKELFLINKSFSGGPGGRFFKKAPLAVGDITLSLPGWEDQKPDYFNNV